MKKKIIIIGAVIVVLLALAHSFAAGISLSRDQWRIYSETLQYFIDDQEVADNINFIAIDTSSFEGLGRKEKDLILMNLEERNNFDIIEATFEELKTKDLVGEGNSIKNGMLLKVEEVDNFLNLAVKIEGSRFHSGLGAYGYEAVFFYLFGEWKCINFKMTWIA